MRRERERRERATEVLGGAQVDGAGSVRAKGEGGGKGPSMQIEVLWRTKDSITQEFTSLTKAGEALKFNRTTVIKRCILSGATHKGYTFHIKE